MKKTIFLLASFLFLTSSVIFSAEPAVLVLDEGANRVALTLFNRSDAALSSVSASVDKTNLPSWLTVQSEPKTVQIPQGAQARDKLFIVFTVKDASSGAEMIVPLTLRDAYGNVWNLPVRVHTSNSQPFQNALYGNYPNPFNPSTTIKYSLKENLRTSLVIYNSIGQKVKTLMDAPQAAGIHTIKWNGKNENGQQVSSGVYIMKLSAGKFVQTRRMMIIE